MLRMLAFALALVAVPAFWPAAGQAAEGPRSTALHLDDSASREVPCNWLRVELTLETAAAEPAAAQDELNRKITAALPLVKGKTGVELKTGGYTSYADRSEKQITTWRVRQSIWLAGGDSAMILGLVGKLQQKGLALTQLNYELTPDLTRATQAELTTQALQRLRERAEQAAKDLGLSFAGWTSVEIGSANQAPPPRPMLRMQASAASASYAPPVAPAGTAIVQVSVRAEAALTPAK